jgi:hypothetical protein
MRLGGAAIGRAQTRTTRALSIVRRVQIELDFL